MRSVSILFVITGIFTCISCSTKKKNIDCTQFKTGKFELRSSNTGRKYIIERNDSTQLERDVSSDSALKFRINWFAPCEYSLTFITYVINGKPIVMQPGENHPYTVVTTRIITAKKNYYVFESKADDYSIRDTIVKIK